MKAINWRRSSPTERERERERERETGVGADDWEVPCVFPVHKRRGDRSECVITVESIYSVNLGRYMGRYLLIEWLKVGKSM